MIAENEGNTQQNSTEFKQRISVSIEAREIRNIDFRVLTIAQLQKPNYIPDQEEPTKAPSSNRRNSENQTNKETNQ